MDSVDRFIMDKNLPHPRSLKVQERAAQKLLNVGRGSTANPLSQPYTTSNQEKRLKRLKKLTIDLQKIANERDELWGILAHYTNKELSNREIDFETIMLKMQHQQVMANLQKMPQYISEALYIYIYIYENLFYCIRHCHVLRESTYMKHKVKILWNENIELLRDKIALEESCEETTRLFVKASMKIYDLCAKQQQVG
ncbi:disks large homolog 5-like [Mastomys coucha]|uniref:disks large homolog 5-like n=1 Tax=Mastomys coucha TaxID=35658 RepID=UPI0012620E58|nr:disks large homolog 5-like [Mastomys coucha]